MYYERMHSDYANAMRELCERIVNVLKTHVNQTIAL